MSKVKFVSANDREAVLLSLEEAAQEIADKLKILREVLKADALGCLSETHQQLDAELETLNLDSFASFYPGEFEEQDEYECIGCIDGTYGGRWMLAAFAENAAAVWPDGTAVYVRRRVKE
jgi:hypothetical protein